MTIAYNTSIAAPSNLVFYYDEKNRYRGFLGKPKTNLFAEPNNFGGASWTKTNTTVSTFTVTTTPIWPRGYAPDVTASLHYLVETATAGQHYASQSIALTSGTTYVVSVYARAEERTQIWLNLQGEAISFFNLANGTITANGNICEMTYYGDGWYRCSAAILSTATSTRLVYVGIANGGVSSYTGTNGYRVILRQAQLETTDLTQHVTGTRTTADNCYSLLSTTPLTANNMSFSESGAIFTGAQYAAINSTFDAFGNDYTLDTWSKFTTTGVNMIAGRASPFLAYQADNRIQFASVQPNGNYVDMRSIGTVTAGEWHHISATHGYDTDSKITTMRIYIDGKFDSAMTFNGSFNNSVHSGFDFAIGAYYTGSPELYNMNGSISNVKVYNKALTNEEVYQNYIAHKEVYS